jgi:hypothetical protein
MGIMCTVDILDNSVSGECGGSRGSGMKGRGRWRQEVKMEEKAENIVEGEKEKWGKRERELSKFIFGQKGGGR